MRCDLMHVGTAIYRGCFDAFKAVKQLTDDYVGCRNQTWNNRVRRWCLCDTDLCNRFPIEQNYRRLSGTGSVVHRRPRIHHHHPLPPPQPAAPSKNYLKSAETNAVDGDPKGALPTSFRTVWTSRQASPGTRRYEDRRSAEAEKKKDGAPRRQNRAGHVVSHSVYPDEWNAVVDRHHAKSSDSVAVGGRSEPLQTYGGEGQVSRSNNSASRGAQRYRPSNVEARARSASVADRQSSRGTHSFKIIVTVNTFTFRNSVDVAYTYTAR